MFEIFTHKQDSLRVLVTQHVQFLHVHLPVLLLLERVEADLGAKRVEQHAVLREAGSGNQDVTSCTRFERVEGMRGDEKAEDGV